MTTIRPHLRDTALDAELERNGFVILRNFLNQEEVANLTDLYQKTRTEKTLDDPNNQLLNSSKAAGFYANITVQDSYHRKYVDGGIKNIVDPKLPDILESYKPVFANFIIKDSIPESAVVPHLDWPVVDESRYSALRFWIPLQDVNDENSTIGVFPGSHRKIKLIRGTPRYSFPYQDYAHELYDLALYPEMQAGDALFFFNELLHCSKANRSGKVRLAFDYQLAPSDARLYHYYFPPNTHEVLSETAILDIEQWEVSSEFFVTFHIQKPLEGPYCRKVADIKYHWRKISKQELGL